MGNLLQIVTARRLQDAGHVPFALVGGATGMIGDPKESGERTLNSLDVVQAWVEQGRASRSSRSCPSTGANAATMVEQLRLDREPVHDRLPARHRQALPGQPDARPRRGPDPARERASPTPSSATCCCSRWTTSTCYRDHGVHAAVRRQRPVGEHHRRRRADPTRRRRPGARARDPAGHEGGRHEVRQDRGRRAVARPGDALAVRLLPVLAQRRGREGRRAAARVHLPDHAEIEELEAQTAEKPFLRAGPAGAGRAGHDASCTARGDRADRGRLGGALRRRRPAGARRRHAGGRPARGRGGRGEARRRVPDDRRPAGHRGPGREPWCRAAASCSRSLPPWPLVLATTAALAT